MIQPELFSDSHQAFEHFRKVTNLRQFLKSKKSLPPSWPLILLLAAWLTAIWILHLLIPSPVVRVLLLPEDSSSVFGFCVILGTIAQIPLIVMLASANSRFITRRLKEKGILVEQPDSWGLKVQQLMLQEFTDYLAKKGLCNPEALDQLMENTRDEIEARWRPSPVVFLLITLTVAVIIAYYQTVFSRWLELHVLLSKGIKRYAILGVVLIILLLCWSIYYVLKLRFTLFH
jgi:hypothetical protein